MKNTNWEGQSEKYGQFIHHEYIFTPAFKKIIEEFKLSGKKIIDLGCGIGEQVRILADEYKCSVIGIDINKDMIDRALKETRNKNVKYIVKDAKIINYKNNSFEAAFMNTFLCNLSSKKDVEKVIREASRILKPKGFLIISNPHPMFENYSFLQRRERFFPEEFDYFKDGQRYMLKLYKTDGTSLESENFHYPLETYLDILSKNKMKILKIIEPHSNLKYKEEKKVPVYIIIIAQKNG